MTKTYITYWFPSLLFSASASEEVKNRNIPKKLPKRCYGFQFNDVTSTEVDGEVLVGKAKNHSKLYLIGKKITTKEIPNTEDNRILRANLDGNNKGIGVKCHTGNWRGWDKNVEVLSVKDFEFEDRYV